MKKKFLSLILAAAMLASVFATVHASEVVMLPRNETLYVAGLQWGAIRGWNALSADMNNAMAIDQAGHGTRVPMFETLYMYNMLDNSFVPLLAYGPPEWGPNREYMTVNLNPNARWNDGTPVTAYDVQHTFDLSIRLMNSVGAAYYPFIERIDVITPHQFRIVNRLIETNPIEDAIVHLMENHADLLAAQQPLVNEVVNFIARNFPEVFEGVNTMPAGRVPVNPLMTYMFLSHPYILQSAWMTELEIRNDFDNMAMLQDPAEDIPFSGPYGPMFADDTRVILVRNDDYWGQHESMWGQLPAPRFLAHTIFADNAAGDLALRAGEVDVSQQFTANVHLYWLEDDLPISTFMDEPPFGIGSSLPTIYFNFNNPALQNVYIRRAIAKAVDYDAIIANAMTNQSATFHEVPRSMMNPTAGEQATFDSAAVAHLQWAGNDIELANQILDDAGILRNAAGQREYNGVPLAFTAYAPQGWSDWEATIEIVAAAGELIGIEITTSFPDWSIFQTVVTTPQNDYDIFMMWTDSSSPTQPWGRIRQLMSSEFPPLASNWSGNWGHFINERADEIIALIPMTTDPDELMALYTEAVYIYLTYVPSFTAMYRPAQFHVINESVWTGFTEYGDGRNVPPLNALDGYAIADLFNIRLTGN